MNYEQEELNEHRKRLIMLRNQLEREIERAPKGRLRVATKGKYTEYYMCDEGAGTSGMLGKYLKKKDVKIIRALAQKDYDNKLLKEILEQLDKIDMCPLKIGPEELKSVYENLSETRKKHVTPRIKPTAVEVAEWLSISYEPLGFSENDGEIYTDSGKRVRSKSEKFIAEKLESMGIPYKYECPIELEGWGLIYPDFTVLNKNTMEVSWLEHLGMMDDRDYSVKAVAKVRAYEKTGIYVGKNLFLTMETKATPFDARCIEAMFRDFV